MTTYQIILIIFVLWLTVEILSNPILKESPTTGDGTGTDPCIWNYSSNKTDKCVPNNRCNYVPLGYKCKHIGKYTCELRCSETNIEGLKVSCGSLGTVGKLQSNYQSRLPAVVCNVTMKKQ